MRSSFFEFHVAKTALFTSRAGLEVTSHNVANSAIDGYSRQYIEQRATMPLTYFNGKGMIGTGSEVYGIGQVRNVYLDQKYWHEKSTLGEYSSKLSSMTLVEKIFAEMSGTGKTSGFNLFFATLQDLTGNAGDPNFKLNVVKAGENLAEFINGIAGSLRQQQDDINQEIKTVVQRINSLGQQIASLNEQIAKFELDGSRANDLRDSRTRLIDELSIYVNVEVKEIEKNKDYAAGLYPEPDDRGKSNKEFYIMINGYEFVNHTDINTLQLKPRVDKNTNVGFNTNPMDVSGLFDIYFDNGAKFDLYHPELRGELRGLIDARDGNNGNHMTGNATYDGAGTITFTNPSRTDMSTNGYVTVTDANGVKKVISYTGYTVAGGNVTINVNHADMPTALPIKTAVVGQTSEYKGIPHYMDKLNELVRTFARAINEGKDRSGNQIGDMEGHIGGFDGTGNESNKEQFFNYKGILNTKGAIADYNLLNCLNFQVNQVLVSEPDRVNNSDLQTGGIDNNQVIFDFIELKEYKNLFKDGKLQDYVIGISGELGVDVNQAKKFAKNSNDIVSSIDDQRISVYGVDLNEEIVFMLKYQHIYTAASKLINIIDGIYDTTINRMGV